MRGVTSHVSGPGGVTRSAGRETSRTLVGSAGSAIAGQCGGSRHAGAYFTARPHTRCFNGFARSVIVRVLFPEKSNQMLGAVGSQKRK